MECNRLRFLQLAPNLLIKPFLFFCRQRSQTLISRTSSFLRKLQTFSSIRMAMLRIAVSWLLSELFQIENTSQWHVRPLLAQDIDSCVPYFIGIVVSKNIIDWRISAISHYIRQIGVSLKQLALAISPLLVTVSIHILLAELGCGMVFHGKPKLWWTVIPPVLHEITNCGWHFRNELFDHAAFSCCMNPIIKSKTFLS